MSAILGVFGRELPNDGTVRRMLGAMRARGAERVAVWRGEHALLAVGRYEWEAASDLSGDAMVVHGDDCVVVADASLFYRNDLCRKLRAHGVAASSDLTASELVLAAYRAWGAELAVSLEGDFAFIVWDARERRVVCARDFGGKRPLYHAMFGRSLVVASGVAAVIEHPASTQRLNAPFLAATISQFWRATDETCYLDVRELLAGSTLQWSLDATAAHCHAHWTPPAIGTARRPSLEEGAETLRDLLMRAVEERLTSNGEPTSVWMSGGWDSSSVFAAGQAVLERTGLGHSLRPVSISYPDGDPGREDELITAIANRWHSPVHWLDVERIPLLHQAQQRARERDLPFAHTYEHWNRALAKGSREIGARVAFDGNGGDQLFQVSDAFLSDLLARGRWVALAREWRTKGGKGAGTFLRWVVAPLLPLAAAQVVQRIRGGTRVDYLERPLARWIRPDFAREHDLVGRERAQMPRSGRGWRREAHFFLASPSFPRAFQCLSAFALESGVELRSPLYDGRIVAFACSRPREERNAGRETKRLLRRAMHGLLPDEVLAPRPIRTGITTAYSDRRMRESYLPLMEPMLDSLRLEALGIVDRRALEDAWAEFLETGANSLKIPLFLTLQAELWLRGREEANVPAAARTHDGTAVAVRH